MKYLFTIALFFLSFGLMHAQEETLLGDGKITHGGFGGPAVKFAKIKNELGVLAGGYGGWLINHTVMLGAGGFGLSNRIKADAVIQAATPGKTQYIQFGYGGFMMEYIPQNMKLLHPVFQMLIGGGGINYVLFDDFDQETIDNDHFFVLEGSAGVELNVVKYMRIDLTAGYRFISGVDMPALENSDFSGGNVSLTLKFGSF